MVAVRTWGIPPSEFWAMDVREFFWLVRDQEKRTAPVDRSQAWAGRMTDADVARGDEMLKRLKAKELTKHGQ